MACHHRKDVCRYRITYWKLPCSDHVYAYAARAAMDKRHFYYPKSAKRDRLIQLYRRAKSGLISYEQCSAKELKGFMKTRGLRGEADGLASKAEIVKYLESADKELSFHRFMDLPPELRLRIYALHFRSFNIVSFEPAPILAASSLVRREARPLFYENSRFEVVIPEIWTSPTRDTRSRLVLQPEKAVQRFFDSLDLDALSRINKLRVVYYGGESGAWNIDILGSSEEDMVGYKGRPIPQSWRTDLDKEVQGAVTSELLAVAKDIAARPRRHKVEREDLSKLAGLTISQIVVLKV